MRFIKLDNKPGLGAEGDPYDHPACLHGRTITDHCSSLWAIGAVGNLHAGSGPTTTHHSVATANFTTTATDGHIAAAGDECPDSTANGRRCHARRFCTCLD